MLKNIYNELFVSKEIVNFLVEKQLKMNDVLAIIGGAPVSLKRKKELIEFLIEERKQNGIFECMADIDEEKCSDIWTDENSDGIQCENALLNLYLNEVNFALSKLNKKDDEIFLLLLNTCFKDGDENCCETIPISRICDAKSYIMEKFAKYTKPDKFFYGELSEEKYKNLSKKLANKFLHCNWYKIEKWKYVNNDNSKKYKCFYSYTILPEKDFEICYFKKYEPDDKRFVLFDNLFEANSNLNIVLPFKAGDILTTNCYPFVKQKYFVLSQNGNSNDCCTPFAFYVESKQVFCGAVKHNHAFRTGLVWPYSCLYNLERCKTKLPKKQSVLYDISNYINHSESSGYKIENLINYSSEVENLTNYLKMKEKHKRRN